MGSCCVKSGYYNLSADRQSRFHGSTPKWSDMILTIHQWQRNYSALESDFGEKALYKSKLYDIIIILYFKDCLFFLTEMTDFSDGWLKVLHFYLGLLAFYPALCVLGVLIVVIGCQQIDSKPDKHINKSNRPVFFGMVFPGYWVRLEGREINRAIYGHECIHIYKYHLHYSVLGLQHQFTWFLVINKT